MFWGVFSEHNRDIALPCHWILRTSGWRFQAWGKGLWIPCFQKWMDWKRGGETAGNSKGSPSIVPVLFLLWWEGNMRLFANSPLIKMISFYQKRSLLWWERLQWSQHQVLKWFIMVSALIIFRFLDVKSARMP